MEAKHKTILLEEISETSEVTFLKKPEKKQMKLIVSRRKKINFTAGVSDSSQKPEINNLYLA